MAKFEALDDETVKAARGGTANGNINTENWQGAHWQPTQYAMGATFEFQGRRWYRIKNDETLGVIAQRFRTTPAQLRVYNPATITNVNQVYPGDAIIVGWA